MVEKCKLNFESLRKYSMLVGRVFSLLVRDSAYFSVDDYNE